MTQFQEYYSYSFVGMVGEIGGWTGILLGLRLLISLYILRAHTYYIGTDFPLAMIVSNGIFVKILLKLTFNEISKQVSMKSIHGHLNFELLLNSAKDILVLEMVIPNVIFVNLTPLLPIFSPPITIRF